MWPYWFLFIMAAWRATIPASAVLIAKKKWANWWWLMYGMLVLIIGFRHEVGADWFSYVEHIRLASFQPLKNLLTQSDPAYKMLNWVAARLNLELYFVNTVCAVLFVWGLLVFCRAQPRPWLALVVAVPYLVTVVAMGYTRQGVAIGLAMLGLVALSNRKIFSFILFVVLAAVFHKSAVILMPLAVLASTKQKLWTAFWVSLSFALFYVLLLQDSVEVLQYSYLEKQYQSQGALLRLAMNAVPAVLFLWFRRRFLMPQAARAFWTWMSLGALGFLGLLVISPSSTAVDRLALYWIPLQLFVLSRLPDVLGSRNGKNSFWVWVVVCYSAAVLFVWLFFSTHAFAWLPYQFYPWVALWS